MYVYNIAAAGFIGRGQLYSLLLGCFCVVGTVLKLEYLFCNYWSVNRRYIGVGGVICDRILVVVLR